jgi:membrane peptidoglycan carboxypeptidase
MTSPARRLGVTSGRVRLSPRARAVIATRHAALPARRARAPIGQTILAIVVTGVIALTGIVGVVALAAIGVVDTLSAGLPDPANLGALTFAQPTIVYDRTGTVQLAVFEREKRRVVSFDEVPRLVLDTTTTAEDRTFWLNQGFDPAAIVAAAFQNANGEQSGERGASTITQQLVRARLLPPSVTESGDRYLRKALEVIQAARLTSSFPGTAGKEKIITAYLNEIYYGHEAYGIAAAAQIYFGVSDLAKLTPAQAALLAGLPKAPSTYDPYHYAHVDENGDLVVDADSPPVVRRNYILANLSASRWTHLTDAELQAALDEPVVLTGDHPAVMRAPQFSWAVRAQLEQLLGSPDAVDTGGYKVITTLDWKAQQLAERYMTAAAIVPNIKRDAAEKLLDRMKIPAGDRDWIAALRGKDIHNGALVAIDYRRGDVLAYVGSAGYYRDDLASAKFQPEHDAASALRQPGSAFKPIVYSAAFEENVLTPGSLLLDISTQFGKDWAPRDADELERGPVLVRQALQMSLNLPAIRALQRVGNESVAEIAAKLGIRFPGTNDLFLQAGLAGAIGTVETRPIDLTAAFGSIANGGVHMPTRLIRSIAGPNGEPTYEAPSTRGDPAISPQSAFLTTDILAGNTDPRQNAFWSATLALQNGPDGSRRPAAAKTGTADNRRDFSTYGFLAPPADPDAPALAAGVWMGNSDHSAPQTAKQATSLQTAGQVWHSFMRDYTRTWPVATFKPPKGVVRAEIDRWSGGKPGPWTVATITEWFKAGTQPGGEHAVDEAGLLYSDGCGSWVVDPVKAELGPERWDVDVQDWVDRARGGAGVLGPLGSTTAYWFGERSWGGTLIGSCDGNPGSGPGGGGHGHHKPRRRPVRRGPAP